MLTQQEIADHLDLSQAAVSLLMGELGMDWKAASLADIRVAYIRRLREIAAGRATNGDLDLATERAALARAQRERIEMKNAVDRGELAPVSLIEEVLTKAAARTAGILDAIPGMVRRRVPQLSADEIDLIAVQVAAARNIVAGMSLADLREEEEAADGASAVPPELMLDEGDDGPV